MPVLGALFGREKGSKEFITLVSGLPRSGTSMMMSALKAGGMTLLTDGIRTKDGNNPKGYFEYERVKKLSSGDVRWLGSAQGKAVKIISALLEYLPEGFEYRVIFMERNLSEILDSQHRMLVRDGRRVEKDLSDDDLRRSYEQHLYDVKAWLAVKLGLRTLFVSYNDILRQPEQEFEKVAEFLENRVDPRRMAEVVDPKLYREKNLQK